MKQMTSIMEEVNYDFDNTKIVKCLAAHNEADWIEYNLANNYDEFNIIRIVEGAVNGRPKSTDDGHSTDNTLELIKNFPDPDNKIELYTIGRFFKTLEEQKQIFLDLANPGEWLVIVDCDEFYLEGDIEKVRKAIHTRPGASEFIPTFLNFYRDFFHVKDYHPEWNLWHGRIIKYQPGLRYYTHPVATDRQGKCTYFDPGYQPKRFMLPGVNVFHYGHAKGEEFVRLKQEFYKSELSRFKLEDGTDASQKFDEKFVEFVNYKEDMGTILYYDGPHPKAIDKHPQRNEESPHYKGMISSFLPEYARVRDLKESWAYNSRLPTIPQWMIAERMQEFYNEVEV